MKKIFEFKLSEGDLVMMFMSKCKLFYTPNKDKYKTDVTQCVIFRNGLLEGFGQVKRHSSDTNQPSLACKKAMKKAMKNVCMPDTDRKNVWEVMLEKFNVNF